MAKLILSDQDFNSQSRILNLLNPTAAQHAATKAYVDSAVEGLAWKDNVRVGSTANITLATPGANIDGIAMVLNDRFLAKNQTSTPENGIYIWNGAAAAATRAADASTSDELEQAVVTVDEGTNAGATFRQTVVNFVLDTGSPVFSPFGGNAAASETVSGIAEIATQAETDGGTDDLRIVTPLKLATYSGRKFKTTGTLGDAAATAFAINHNFNTRAVVVEVYKNSGNFDTVQADVTRTSVNQVTITFASPPAAAAYAYVITA